MGIVVIGAVFVDIKGYPLKQYIPGGRNVGRVIQVHGGVSRNAAEDLANIGLNPVFLSVVDNSGTGNDVLERLKASGVNTDYIIRENDGLGTWLAVFDNTGDVVASISKRPDLSGISAVLDQHGDEIFSAADSILVEFDIEKELIDRIFALAEKYGKEVYALVSNMSIALERRDLLQKTGCIVCNTEEAGLLFSEEYEGLSRKEMVRILRRKVSQARIPRMVVTMGGQGAAYAENNGESGSVPALKVDVLDTTGCGDSFFAGAAAGLTYGKTLHEACEIGTRLAASVISTKENVCPKFMPEEFGLPDVRQSV